MTIEVFSLKHKLGKWEQHLLLQHDPIIKNSLPESKIYNFENLSDMLIRHDYVYVKSDILGQGRGMFKVEKNQNGDYCFNGFTLHGIRKNMCVSSIEDFHPILHPYAKFGRLSGSYIIQEGIKSITPNGQPFCFRVHVQNLKGKWVIGGIYAKIADTDTAENGIVNSHRGAQVLSVDDLLVVHMKMNLSIKNDVIQSLNKLSVSVAEIIAVHYPNREYGLDFGLNHHGKPILFEVNTTPGIGGFAKVENKSLWRRIVEIRKRQQEG